MATSPSRAKAAVDPGATAGREVPWEAIATEWRRDRRYDTLETEIDEGTRDCLRQLLGRGPVPDRKTAAELMRAVFEGDAARQRGPVLVATWVYGRCLEKWERSAAYGRIGLVLDALRDEAGRQCDDGAADSDELQVLRMVTDHAQHLKAAMQVENGVQCSCPVAAEEHAAEVVEKTEDLLSRDGLGKDGDTDGALALIRSDIEVTRAYYEQVGELAGAVSGLITALEQEEVSQPNSYFETVIDGLKRAIRSPALEGDVYQTDLSAHLVNAQALERSLSQPWLRLVSTRFAFVYPFALDDDAEALVARALTEAPRWRIGNSGLEPDDVDVRELSDAWDSTDPLARPYGGARIRLPVLRVKTTAHEAVWREQEEEEQRTGRKVERWPLLKLEPELRLSDLGNHYLSVRYELDDATVHDVNQAIRRASVQMGEEKITCGSGEWTRVADYAKEVIQAGAEHLGSQVVGDPVGDYHVVVGIRAASLEDRKADGEPLSVEKLKGAPGASLIFQPVGDFATTLEEWARYAVPELPNLLEGGREDHLLVRTTDTTVVYLPMTPQWKFNQYEELAEFVASLPSLLDAWEKQVRIQAKELKDGLTELSDASADGGERLRKLHLKEAEFLSLGADIRDRLADLHSPRLVENQIVRVFLDRLWDSARLPELEQGLDRQLAVVATLQERLAAKAAGIAEYHREQAEQRQREAEEREKQAEEQREKLARRVQVWLTVIAATSLAGLFDWLNNGLVLRDRSFVLVELGLVLAVAFGFWQLARERRERQRQSESDD